MNPDDLIRANTTVTCCQSAPDDLDLRVIPVTSLFAPAPDPSGAVSLTGELQSARVDLANERNRVAGLYRCLVAVLGNASQDGMPTSILVAIQPHPGLPATLCDRTHLAIIDKLVAIGSIPRADWKREIFEL
jgi:hypothetical protein